jgi:sulfate-transporting ATPase
LVTGTKDGLDRLVAKSRALTKLLAHPFVKWFAKPIRTTFRLSPSTEKQVVDQKKLEVRDLTVRFGGVVAVNQASLDVNPGEIVGLIGPNGAGKTTFIDAVTGFVKAAGEMVLDGKDIARASAHRRVRLGVARSWQSLELFEDVTVGENLQAANESNSRRWRDGFLTLLRPGVRPLTPAATAAISQFELTEDLDRLPTDLSYARRRLVGIARAVSLQPSVLLLDEPAAGLGTTEARELGALIQDLAKGWGMGILLVEHDVDLVMSICDRVVVLDFGQVIAEGPPEVVRANEQVVAAYLGEPTDSADVKKAAEAAEGPVLI